MENFSTIERILFENKSKNKNICLHFIYIYIKKKQKIMDLFQIDIGYTMFSLEVSKEENIITHAPGVAKWSIGKNWDDVKKYYISKKSANIKKIRL